MGGQWGTKSGLVAIRSVRSEGGSQRWHFDATVQDCAALMDALAPEVLIGEPVIVALSAALPVGDRSPAALDLLVGSQGPVLQWSFIASTSHWPIRVGSPPNAVVVPIVAEKLTRARALHLVVPISGEPSRLVWSLASPDILREQLVRNRPPSELGSLVREWTSRDLTEWALRTVSELKPHELIQWDLDEMLGFTPRRLGTIDHSLATFMQSLGPEVFAKIEIPIPEEHPLSTEPYVLTRDGEPMHLPDPPRIDGWLTDTKYWRHMEPPTITVSKGTCTPALARTTRLSWREWHGPSGLPKLDNTTGLQRFLVGWEQPSESGVIQPLRLSLVWLSSHPQPMA